MIKAIIFDLGGVVYTNGTKKFIKTVAQRYGLAEDLVKDVMDGAIGSAYREARISRDEFWHQVLEKLHITEDIDKLEDEWIQGYDMIEGTKNLIDELKKKYKVYYLSDNVKERIDRLEAKYHFNNWFNGGIFSHEAGVRKPNPKIYKLVLEKIGMKPEETVFIDDKPHFLKPAADLGMKTIVFENPEQVADELKLMGVPPGGVGLKGDIEKDV